MRATARLAQLAFLWQLRTTVRVDNAICPDRQIPASKEAVSSLEPSALD